MRTVLRRGAALRVAPVALALALVTTFSRGTPWRGEWAWTLDWASGAVVVLGPMVAGVAALDSARWRGLNRDLVPGGRRPGLAVLLPSAVSFAVGVALLVVVLAVTAAVTATRNPAVELDPTSPALAVLALLVAALLGGALGTWWPSPVAALVAGVGVFALALLPGLVEVPPILRVGGVTGSLAGLAPSTGYVLGSAAVAGAVAAAAGAWVVATRSGRVVASVLTVGALVASVAFDVAGPQERFVAQSSPPLRCAGDVPEVCLSTRTPMLLDVLPGQLAEAAAPLERIGLEVPTRYVQSLPGAPLPDGAPLYLGPELLDERLPADVVDQVLTVPAACRADVGDAAPPQAVFDARLTIASWLAVQDGRVQPTDLAGRPDTAWLARPEGEQVDWLRTTYAALTECRYDDVRPAP